jgi:outer membrane protein OmpA-like peptidoglycan-associated protein
VLFAPGSAELDDAARATVRQVARQGRAMADALGAGGVQATLTLTGRADATGSDSTNASLSRDRALRVERALQAAWGSGAGRLTVAPDGVGTTQPLAEPDSAARARVNRSVSFGIRLVIPPGARPE